MTREPRRPRQPWRRHEPRIGLESLTGSSSLAVERWVAAPAWLAGFGAGLTGGNGASLARAATPDLGGGGGWRRGRGRRGWKRNGGRGLDSGDCEAAGAGAATGAAGAGGLAGAGGGADATGPAGAGVLTGAVADGVAAAGPPVAPAEAVGPKILRRRRIFGRRASDRVGCSFFGTGGLALGRLRACLSERPRSASLEVATLGMARGGALGWTLRAAAMEGGPLGGSDFICSSQKIAPTAARAGERERRDSESPGSGTPSRRQTDRVRIVRMGNCRIWSPGSARRRRAPSLSVGAKAPRLTGAAGSFRRRRRASFAPAQSRPAGARPAAAGALARALTNSTSRTNSASISSAFACWPPGARGGRPIPSRSFSATRTLAGAPHARGRRQKKGQLHNIIRGDRGGGARSTPSVWRPVRAETSLT